MEINLFIPNAGECSSSISFNSFIADVFSSSMEAVFLSFSVSAVLIILLSFAVETEFSSSLCLLLEKCNTKEGSQYKYVSCIILHKTYQ